MGTLAKRQFVQLLVDNNISMLIDPKDPTVTYGIYQGWWLLLSAYSTMALRAHNGDPFQAQELRDFYHASRPYSRMTYDDRGFVYPGEDDSPYDIVLHVKTLTFQKLMAFGDQYLPACGLVRRQPAPQAPWEFGTWIFRPSQASFGYVLEGNFVSHFLKYAGQCDPFVRADVEEGSGTAVIHSLWGLQFVLTNLFAYVNLYQCK